MRRVLLSFCVPIVAVACADSSARAPADDSVDASAPVHPSSMEIHGSASAGARIEALRARFTLRKGGEEPVANPGQSALPRGSDIRFEMVDQGPAGRVVRAEVSRGAEEVGVPRVRVTLPLDGAGAVALEDSSSRVALRFWRSGAAAGTLATSDGWALYESREPGEPSWLHRPGWSATEDFIVFERRPEGDKQTYSVDVSRVAGLRLLGNVLEFLDEHGAPRLRLAEPWLLDAEGRTQGCA